MFLRHKEKNKESGRDGSSKLKRNYWSKVLEEVGQTVARRVDLFQS